MPHLVRFYIRHCLIGFGVALAFVAALFWFDVAGLWRLVSGSDQGVLAAVLLVVFHGIVFSGAQFGIAIMRLAQDDTTPPRGGRTQLIPIRIDDGQPGQPHRQ